MKNLLLLCILLLPTLVFASSITVVTLDNTTTDVTQFPDHTFINVAGWGTAPRAINTYQSIQVQMAMSTYYDFQNGATEGYDETTGYFRSNNGASFVCNLDGQVFSDFTSFIQTSYVLQFGFQKQQEYFEVYMYPHVARTPEPATLLLSLLGIPFLKRRIS